MPDTRGVNSLSALQGEEGGVRWAPAAETESAPPYPNPLPPNGELGLVSVDLGAIVENWRLIRRRVGHGCEVAAAVKADG